MTICANNYNIVIDFKKDNVHRYATRYENV